MVDLLDTMAELPDIIVDLPDTMIDHSEQLQELALEPLDVAGPSFAGGLLGALLPGVATRTCSPWRQLV